MFQGIGFNRALEIINEQIGCFILNTNGEYKLYSSETDSDVSYTKTFVFFYFNIDCIYVITFNYIRPMFFMTVSCEFYDESNLISFCLNGKRL